MSEPNGQVLYPYLIVKDAVKAIDFYGRVFGAVVQNRLTEPGGKIAHADLQIGESSFMLADEFPDFGALSPVSVGGSPVRLYLYVEDADRVVKDAVAAGATLLRPVEDKFYGDRTGMIADPFGHQWHIATWREEVSPEELQKRYSAALR